MSESKAQKYQRWIKYGEQHLLGRKVVEVRLLTDSELSNLGWDNATFVIFFNDGTYIFPSQDDEGNGPGALFGHSKKHGDLTFPVM